MSRTARANVLWRSSSSSSRPTNGTEVRVGALSSETETSRTPPPLPGSRVLLTPSGSPPPCRASAARRRAEDDLPGAAACWSRAAALIARPVAKVVSSRPRRSRRLDPDPHLEPEVYDCIDDRQRCPHGALRHRPRAQGAAERGHHGVARVLLARRRRGRRCNGKSARRTARGGSGDLGIGRSRRAASSRRGRRRAPSRASVPSPKDSARRLRRTLRGDCAGGRSPARLR